MKSTFQTLNISWSAIGCVIKKFVKSNREDAKQMISSNLFAIWSLGTLSKLLLWEDHHWEDHLSENTIILRRPSLWEAVSGILFFISGVFRDEGEMNGGKYMTIREESISVWMH